MTPPPTLPPVRLRRKLAPLARLMLIASAGLAVAAFAFVLVASLQRTSGIEGWLGGVFVGLFAALLILLAGAWLALGIITPKTVPPPIDQAAADALHTPLADLLDELEASRRETVRKANARAWLRVPLCAGGGMAIWIAGQYTDEPGELFELAALVAIGAAAGYAWATTELGRAYARLYKSRVLPRLASGFGDITYRPAIAPDMQRLKAEGVFSDFTRVIAEDQLVGRHRGLPICITGMTLEWSMGKSTTTVFSGLLLQVDLPKRLSGTTAVIADQGAIGNFQERLGKNGRERVKLEDPVFERAYEVYGTDQVEARALLNPAFMERLLALGRFKDFGLPLAFAQDNRLTIAWPKTGGRTLFQSPSVRKPAGAREILIRLRDDIAAMLDAADAVIGLESPALARSGATWQGLAPAAPQP